MRKTIVSALVAVLALAPVGVGLATAQQTPAGQKVGNFSLAPFETLRFRFPGTSMTVSGVGANGGRIVAQSPDYEIAARQVNLRFDKASANSPFKATRGDATGNVRVVVRQPLQRRTTVVTCARAVYTATVAANDRGQIALTGGVRSELTDPGLQGPLVTVAQTGTIRFGPDGTPEVDVQGGPQGGSIRGTIIEPAPRPKKPGP